MTTRIDDLRHQPVLVGDDKKGGVRTTNNAKDSYGTWRSTVPLVPLRAHATRRRSKTSQSAARARDRGTRPTLFSSERVSERRDSLNPKSPEISSFSFFVSFQLHDSPCIPRPLGFFLRCGNFIFLRNQFFFFFSSFSSDEPQKK